MSEWGKPQDRRRDSQVALTTTHYTAARRARETPESGLAVVRTMQ